MLYRLIIGNIISSSACTLKICPLPCTAKINIKLSFDLNVSEIIPNMQTCTCEFRDVDRHLAHSPITACFSFDLICLCKVNRNNMIKITIEPQRNHVLIGYPDLLRQGYRIRRIHVVNKIICIKDIIAYILNRTKTQCTRMQLVVVISNIGMNKGQRINMPVALSL